MAIKYYTNHEKKQVHAVLSGCEFDAINKIDKFMGNHSWCWTSKGYLMPGEFRAVAKCHPDDVFDEAKGRDIAKERLMKKYYKAFDARIDRFRSDLIELNGKVFETPAELENTP